MLGERPAWYARAACKGQSHVFFPSGRGSPNPEPKRICSECPVREECLEFSIELAQKYETHGVWAGLTKNEREGVMYERGITLISSRAYDPDI